METVKAITDSGKLKKVVPIITGMMDLYSQSASFNTVNIKDPTYRDISPSVNQPSGAEFSYNFWLYKDKDLFQDVASNGQPMSTDSGLTADQYILFVHGDKTATEYKNLCDTNKKDIMVKCPLVKLEQDGDVLSVELNTLKSYDGVHEQSRNTCDEDSREWNFMNSHKLAIFTNANNSTNFNKKWFMVTLIINDTTPEEPIPLRNKVRVRIYINGILELDRYVDDSLGFSNASQSSLRRNTGNLHISPKVTIPGTSTSTGTKSSTISTDAAAQNKLLMADLTYYNYAITEADIKDRLAKGFNKGWAPVTERSEGITQTLTNKDNMSLPGMERSFNAF
jgi:hypothetical protein